MMRTDYEVILGKLRSARNSALMTDADFSDELKAEIKLHHMTWIIGPLNDAIALLEAAQAGKIKLHRRETYKSLQQMPDFFTKGEKP